VPLGQKIRECIFFINYLPPCARAVSKRIIYYTCIPSAEGRKCWPKHFGQHFQYQNFKKIGANHKDTQLGSIKLVKGKTMQSDSTPGGAKPPPEFGGEMPATVPMQQAMGQVPAHAGAQSLGMESIFGKGDLVSNSGQHVATNTLSANTVVGLYFSAHWCPPCRWAYKSLCSKLLDHIFSHSFDCTAGNSLQCWPNRTT